MLAHPVHLVVTCQTFQQTFLEMLRANLGVEDRHRRAIQSIHAEAQEHRNRLEKFHRFVAGEVLHDDLLTHRPTTVENEVIAKVERPVWVNENPVNEKRKQTLIQTSVERDLVKTFSINSGTNVISALSLIRRKLN